MNNLFGNNKLMDIITDIKLGDCLDVLKEYADDSVNLIFTSPPYADQRKRTYGGIHPDDYVEWFLPRSKEFLRVLKPRGTFVLNIKEKVIDGERSTYVMELILEMRKQGWLWTEEFIWHKKIVTLGNGQIVFGMHGNDCCNLTKEKSLICIKKRLWFPWVIGLKQDLEI